MTTATARPTSPTQARAGPPPAVPAVVALALSIAAGIVFASGPRPDSTAGSVLDYAAAHDTRMRVVAFLVFGTALPLTVYSATAYRRLRRLGVTAPGSAIALTGGMLAATALLLSGLVTWTTAHTAPELSAGTARALTSLSLAAGGIGFAVPLALLIAGIAVPGLVLRLTPRPLALVGLALAAVGVVSSGGLITSALYPLLPIARFGGLLWLVVAGLLPAPASAAAVTSALHVGTRVLCDPLRNPAQLAWEIRTLHELYGERIEIGLGAGRPDAEQDAAALGVPYAGPGERIERLLRTVALLRDEMPRLRLLVAASGPRLLRQAGRHADTVALGWPPATDTRAAREIALRARADGDPELAAGLVAVADVATGWLARLGTSAAQLAAQDAVTVVAGSPRAMADTLLRRRDALGVSYVTVPAAALTEFAPVVAILAGR